MRLSDREIQTCLESGELIVIGPRPDLPFDRYKQVQPCSIDLRLDAHFYRYNSNITQFNVKDLDNIWDYAERFHVEDGQPIVIDPNSIIFGQIYEQLRIPCDVSGKIVGRSRFARLGLSIHATGDFINPEFEGAMPLQIINHNRFPIVIYPYMNICQLVLVKLTSRPIVPYPMKSSNPYHQERVASPSVCQTDAVLQRKPPVPTIHEEVEKRLVDKYLKDQERSELIKGLSINFNEQHKMSQSNSPSTILISGSNIGVFNPGQIIGDVRSTIEAIPSKSETDDIRETLSGILSFVESSRAILSDESQREILEYASDLSKQATLADKHRASKSTLKAMVSGLGELIRTVAAGSSLWVAWGPALKAYFNI